MKPILAQRGFISDARGAQTVRELYRLGSGSFSALVLSEFGRACLFGDLDEVKKLVEDGDAPDITATETPYQHSYAQITLIGLLLANPERAPKPKHYETLEYLISRGVPLDKPDIVGRTALHHAVQCAPSAGNRSGKSFVGLLLESGASVNARNRFGEAPLMNCIMVDNSPADVELLMKHGADVDLADADGTTARNIYLNGGPQITAVIEKWLRKRKGEPDAPRAERACSNGCGTTEGPLKNCSKCGVARYCSRECQTIHWKTHKKACIPFNMQNTVTLRPTYPENELSSIVSISEFTRAASDGTPMKPKSKSHTKSSNIPKKLSSPKSIIIKIQVPPVGDKSPSGQLLVYTKKRDFSCIILKNDAPEAYEAVVKTVWAKGVAGRKAYFAAELKGRDELVVKVAEVLAEQPF